ncbi:MAG: malE 2 [Actinomycetia bacterium]|nr:malE 2 [Actinomycetes bacterium]
MSKSLTKRNPLTVAAVAATALLAAACGGTSTTASTAAPTFGAPAKGEQITVVLPSYAKIPADMLTQFEQQSGVKVTLSLDSWDNIRTRIVTANAAGQAIGDVTEFDWSWTGQFGSPTLYTPLDNAISPAMTADLQNTKTFSKGGHMMAVCYSNDARIGMYNKTKFAAAGITAPPATFDELTADLAKLKVSGASVNPLTLTASATEGATTEWYLLSMMMGGNLFDAALRPQFSDPASAGYKALAFEVEAMRKGWASPSATTANDQEADALFLGGRSAVQLAGHPGESQTANDPTQSKVAGQTAYFLEPGTAGPGKTFGLPEGLGIPARSTHKAAAAAFIRWILQPEVQAELLSKVGLLPCRASAVHALVAGGKIAGGPVIEQQLAHLTPLFPNGAPTWYAKFSTDASALINSAAKGEMTVAQAIAKMSDRARQLGNG